MSKQLLEKLSKIVADGEACAESEIKRKAKPKDPTEAARDYFIEKIDENIAVWKAFTAGEDLPVHTLKAIDKKTGVNKVRKYSRWFKKNEETGRYEITPYYGLRPIKNFFGDGLQTYKGIQAEEIIPFFNALKESAEAKEFDEILLFVRNAARIPRREKK